MQPQDQHAAESVRSAVAAQARRFCGDLDAITRSLHVASENLERQQEGSAASYLDTAANRLESINARLRGKDPAELVREAGQYARTQPGMFFAASVLAGLALSRFLKASQSRPRKGGSESLELAGYTPSDRLDSYSPSEPLAGPDRSLTDGGI